MRNNNNLPNKYLIAYKKHCCTISTLNDTINKVNIAMQNKDYEIKKLVIEIEWLKNNNN